MRVAGRVRGRKRKNILSKCGNGTGRNEIKILSCMYLCWIYKQYDPVYNVFNVSFFSPLPKIEMKKTLAMLENVRRTDLNEEMKNFFSMKCRMNEELKLPLQVVLLTF